MNLLVRIWRSTLGRKYVMALTGVALIVFVIGHLVGNLQVFGPPDLINGYGHFLKGKPILLWGARLSLLGFVVLHMAAAFSLVAANRAARPQGYVGASCHGSTLASRTMALSGLVILAFILYHLLHFTVLQPGINGVGDFSKLKAPLSGESVPDVYAMMILGFQVWWVSLAYVIAQGLLCLHLGHGIGALFQSLGLRNPVWWPRIGMLARVLSIAIFLGYSSIPVAIFAGLGRDYARKAERQLTVFDCHPEVDGPSAATFTVMGRGVVR